MRATPMLLALLLGACLFTGCQAKEPTPEERRQQKMAVLGVLGDPSNLNFLLATEDGPAQAQGILFRGLTRWNEQWDEEPLWASAVPSARNKLLGGSGHRLTVTYLVRNDAHWSDAAALTSDDFMFTYEMSLNLKVRAPGWIRGLGFRTLGTQRLDISVDPSLLEEDLHLLPLPVHLIRPLIVRNSELFMSLDFNREPISCGPYLGKAFGKDRIDLVPNPSYILARPTLSRVQVRFFPDAKSRLAALQAGHLDGATHLLPDEVAALGTAAPDMTVQATPSNSVWCLEFRAADPLLKDRRVREALARALDRPAIAKEVQGPLATSADSWLPPQHPAYQPVFSSLKPDLEAAKKLLAASGLKAGPEGLLATADGKPAELSLYVVAQHDEARRAAPAVLRSWEALGFQVRVQEVSRAELASQFSSGQMPSVVLASLPMGPYVQLLPLFSRGATPSEKNAWLGQNLAGWDSPRNEALCSEYVSNLDVEKRGRILGDHQLLMLADLPLLPLFYNLELSAHRKDLDGWKPRGLGPITWNVEDWKWK